MSLLRTAAIGRLTNNPEFRTVKIGNEDVSVCEFSIAVNYGYGDHKQTEFINCVAWRKLAETIRDYCAKGRKIYIEGKQKTRKYPITKDNVEFTQYKTEIILDDFDFCDSDGQREGRPGGQVDATAPETIIPDAPF